MTPSRRSAPTIASVRSSQSASSCSLRSIGACRPSAAVVNRTLHVADANDKAEVRPKPDPTKGTPWTHSARRAGDCRPFATSFAEEPLEIIPPPPGMPAGMAAASRASPQRWPRSSGCSLSDRGRVLERRARDHGRIDDPALMRSSISPVSTFRPSPFFALRTLSTTTEPSRPALYASWRSGSSSARMMICAPVFSSPSSVSTSVFTA